MATHWWPRLPSPPCGCGSAWLPASISFQNQPAPPLLCALSLPVTRSHPPVGKGQHGALNYRGIHPWLPERARRGFSGPALWALESIICLQIPPDHSWPESQQEVTLSSITSVPVSAKSGQCPLLFCNQDCSPCQISWALSSFSDNWLAPDPSHWEG